jgi:type I restriction enzyme S subunit
MNDKYSMPLKRLSEIIMGQSPESSTYNFHGEGLPFFQGKSEFGEMYPTVVKWCKEPIKIAKAGDILISVRAPVGSTNIAKEDCCIGRGLAAIRVNSDKLNRDFLLLQLKYLEKDLIMKGQGSTFEAIGTDVLYELNIYTPELEKQERIAKNLLLKLTEVRKAKNAAEVKRQELKAMSILQQKIALDILNDLPRLPLKEYLEGIESGKSIKTTELPAEKDELGVLKVSAVSWDRFQPKEAKSVIGNYIPRDEHRVKKGDLIISRANTLELVGAIVLVDKDYPNRLLSDKTLRLKVKPKRVIPEYILHILKLPEARKHIEENATGTSDSMRNISQNTIYNIPIPNADEMQQKEIINLMQGTKKNLQRMDEALKVILEDLKELPTKLLEEFFNNEL